MCIQNWLKYYVLLRLMDRTKPRGAMQVFPLIATFVISAYWHGFFFGYYSFFIGLGLMDIAWKVVPKTQIAQTIAEIVPNPIMRVFNWYICHFALSYFGITFYFLLVQPNLQIWDSLYYVGHWCTIGAIILSSILPKAKRAVKEPSC